MPSGTQDLERFVRSSLMRGCTRKSVETVLLDAGWTPEQVRGALSGFADVEFTVPVPKPRPYLSARDTFIYLVLFTTLYLSAYHFGSLLFQLINRTFPDAAMPYNNGVSQSMRWSVSSIVIAFPVFLWISGRIRGEIAREPIKRQSAARRWLTYLTLFVAAVVVICDLITLVDGVLGGEITARFVLKVLVAAVIACTVFGYYLWDLRSDERVA